MANERQPTVEAKADAAARLAQAAAASGVLQREDVLLGGAVLILVMREHILQRALVERDAAGELVAAAGAICAVAERSGCPELVQAIDWWALVYNGAPLNGQFFVSQAMTPELAVYLSGVLQYAHHRAIPARGLGRMHEARLARLREFGDHVTPTNREVFASLLIDSAAKVANRLAADPRDPLADLVDADPAKLVKQADPAGTVPRNGRRWPELVSLAEEFQRAVGAAGQTARALARLPPTVQSFPAPPDVPPPLQPLLAALLVDIVDHRAGDGPEDELAAVIEAAELCTSADPACLGRVS